MSRCKVVFVGAGSYVFGPAPIRDLLDRQRLPGLELVLVDVNPEMLALTAGVARAVARRNGLDTVIRTETNTAAALEGADFVICAVAIAQGRCFEIDREIIARHAPGHLLTEFGGVHGISMSLRQIAMIESLCTLMRRHCPGAVLLNVANPLPRVCQAAHELGIQTVGFCSVSLGSYGSIWHLLHGETIRFPFSPAVESLRLRIAGLNHHTFVLEATDASGNDLRPEMTERLRAAGSDGNPRAESFLLNHNAMLAVHDGHTDDFFGPREGSRSLDHISHGTAAQREVRLQLLRDIGAGQTEPDRAFEPQAWEYPGDYVAGEAYGRDVAFHSLNLVNEGQISQLPRGIFVETAARFVGGQRVVDHVSLPRELIPYCQRTIAVTDALVQAALTRRRAMVREAVELDPTILDKAAGLAAVEACLEAHRALIGEYS